MRVRSVLCAYAATTLLVSIAPAAADTADPVVLCAGDVACVSLLADPAGRAGVTSGDTCVAPELRPACLPGVTAGTVTSTLPWKYHPWTKACSWGGSPGSRIDYGGHLTPAPPPGVSVDALRLSCSLYVNGTLRGTAPVQAFNGALYAAETDTSTNPGDEVRTCLDAWVRWSDGSWDGASTAGCGPVDET